MTPVEVTKKISDQAALDLPALLLGAGLSDLAEYRNKTPVKSDDLEFCVYIEQDADTTDFEVFQILIQVQLHGSDKDQEYHSVIMPWLKEVITARFVEFEIRDSITSDLWPMDMRGSAFIFYYLHFNNSLDDCDD